MNAVSCVVNGGPAKIAFALSHSIILFACAFAQEASTQHKRMVIAAGTLLGGKGHVLHNTRIVVA